MLQAKEICVLVVARSAKLVAAATQGILNLRRKASDKSADTDIGIDGKLFTDHPLYRDLLASAFRLTAKADRQNAVGLVDLEDGAVFGAAVLAAACAN